MSSVTPRARVAGLMYLGTIAFGVYAEAIARGGVKLSNHAATIVHTIASSVPALRAALLADLAMLACYIVVTVLLYGLLRRRSEEISAIAAAFSMIGIALLGCATLALAAVMRIPGLSSASSILGDLASLLLWIHGDGYKISLVFFGIYCLLLGWLIWRSRTIPKAIGAMVATAGLCNIINSLAWLGAPHWAAKLPQYFTLPTLLGELALAIWLLVFGVREREV